MNLMAEKKIPNKYLAILLSVLIPGLGQVAQRRYRSGIIIFVGFATALATRALVWQSNLVCNSGTIMDLEYLECCLNKGAKRTDSDHFVAGNGVRYWRPGNRV